MKLRLEHIAIHCPKYQEALEFYGKFFAGEIGPERRGAQGYSFRFMKMDGEECLQLMDTAGEIGVHHIGFATDDIQEAWREFSARGAKILREVKTPEGVLRGFFVEDPSGLQIEIRIPH